MLNILIEYGSNPVQPDSEGNTALHYFAREPSAFISQIQRFIDLGLDINARNKQGNTPIFEYVTHSDLNLGLYNKDEKEVSNVHCLSQFKETGADCFAINNFGSSLLRAVAGRRVYVSRTFANDPVTENQVSWFKFLTDLGLDPMLEDFQ